MVDHKSHPTDEEPSGQDEAAAADGGNRVAKALARAGVASRREIERLIEAGRVALNGEVLTTPAVKVAPGDILTVDGKVIDEPEQVRVWRYHKPVGLMTTHNDPKGRPTVFQHLPPGMPRVISIGRLDLNSEGLLLLTNDGELARALELPATGLVRRYRVRAFGRITQERLDKLKDGITVEGVRYGGIEAVIDKAKDGASGSNLWITVTLAEGKNREVRRVLEAVGVTVNRLIRLAYGPFQLGALAVGEVEEVGPRVIREQLAQHIAPENLPTGNRSPPQVGSAVLRKSKAYVDPTPAARAKTVYKPGWAKPKVKPDPHKQGPRRFKPKADPTVISARPLPRKNEDTAKAFMDRREPRRGEGPDGGRGDKSFAKPHAPKSGGKKAYQGKPREDRGPAKPSGASGQPYAGSSPRAPAKPGAKPFAGKGPPRGRR